MYKKAFELSYKNKKVEIEIQDFTGTVRNINGTEDLFSLSYISDSKDKGQSILVTEADINFYADDYFNIDELKTVGETDIKVKYYEDGALLWSGFVIPDFFSTSVDIIPVVSMVATDRIGTLKEISNNAESNIPIQILASCLKQTGQDLPINLIVDNNHFETPIQLERIDEIASYDVIRTFMVLFNCKITLYKNAWWIINKKLLESGFVNYKSYNSDGAGGSVTPFAQETITLDLANRGGQREIKPTASEVSLFLEFGGSRLYPNNSRFKYWDGLVPNDWASVSGFAPEKTEGVNSNSIKFISDTPSTQDDIFKYYNGKHLTSTPSPISFIDDISEITLRFNFTTNTENRLRILPLIKIPNRNPSQHKYYIIRTSGELMDAGRGQIEFNVVPLSIAPSLAEDEVEGANVVQTEWERTYKISKDDLGLTRSSNAELILYIFKSNLNLDFSAPEHEMTVHSANVEFNKSETYGKGLIFKIKQGGEKFSKSRDPETILFSDKINQGVNGYFYNYKYDDTSIVDLPSEFALSSVRERADMFSKARDYYSLDGDFIVNPLAKYTCGSKSFVLVGGENRREDASIVIEEIVSNTLNRTDFIYTYFDDGKDKVKTIGTASGGSSSGGGGSSPSTPQLIKVDDEGNYYSEEPFYSLGGLSAFGFSEVGDGTGGGGIINVIDSLTSTSKTDPLSANMGRYLKTLIDNIEVGEGGQVIVDWEAITGKPSTFAPSAHSHIIGNVTGLQSALDGKASLSQLDDKEDKFTKNSAFNKNFGTGLNDVARGNHTHTFASLTSIPTTLAGYGITDGANKVHTHSISDVTNLQTELDKKATNTALTTHVNKTDNPHSVTKSQVGLGNVANKDLSNVDNIQQATKTEFTSHKNLFDSMFRKVGTNIEAKLSLYSLGGLSAYGYSDEGSGGNGGGIVNILSSWGNYTSDKSGWALSAGLGVDLNTRKADKTWVESLLEDYVPTDTTYTAGRGLTLTGTQFSTSFDIANYATVTALGGKVDKVAGKSLISDVEITRLAGVTNQTRASLNITNVDNTSDANKPISNATQTALNSKLATSIFNTHNTDNIRHITGAERTKWNGVVTDFDGLEIGGRNLLPSNIWENGHLLVGSGEDSDVNRRERLRTFEFISIENSSHYTLTWDTNSLRTVFVLEFDSEKQWIRTNAGVYNWDNTPNPFTFQTHQDSSFLKVVVDAVGIGNINPSDFPMLRVKLEKGNKATDWTPAPEDQVSDWATTDVDSFSFIKNKPTKLSQFSNVETAFINKTQSDGWYASLTNFNSHVNNKSNPHDVTKAQVGLSNVDNIQQATKVEFMTQKALFDTMFRKTPTNEIEAKLSLYTLGGLSAYGFSDEGSSGGGGGIVNILSDWAIYDASKSGWALSAGLGKGLYDNKADKTDPRFTDARTPLAHTHVISDITGLQGALNSKTDKTYSEGLNDRLTSIEGGSATTVNVSGTGDLLASVSKVGNNINFIKGNQSWGNLTGKPSTFAPSAHSHPISDITNLQTTLADKLETTLFNTHNTDNVRHITGAERTKWDGVVTDFGNLEIGGRNLAINTSTEWKSISWASWSWSGTFNKYTDAKPGEYYSISIHLRNVQDSLGGALRLWVRWFDENGIQVGSELNGSLIYDEGVSKATFIIPEGIYGFETLIRGTQRDSTKSCEYRMFKAEKGNKPTDWSPAPEDQVSDWATTDVDSFSFIKNKPTLLSQFTDNIGVAQHRIDFDAFKTTFDTMFRKTPTNEIEAKLSLYTLGGLSAYGFSDEGSSGGGGGIVNILSDWAIYDASKSGWALGAGLGKGLYDNKADKTDPRFTDARTPLAHTHVISDITGLQGALNSKTNQTFSDGLNTRLTSIEGGSATTVNVSGTGDLLASVSKVGNNINFIKGNQSWVNLSGKPSTFAPSAHTHPISNITNLQTTLNSKLETSIFNTHNNDNVRHITEVERTKWDGVVGDFATHIANKSNPHLVTTAQIGAVDLTTNQTIGGVKSFTSSIIGNLSGKSNLSKILVSDLESEWTEIWALSENYRMINSINPSSSFYGVASKFTAPTRRFSFFGLGVENAWIGLHTGDAYFRGNVGIGRQPSNEKLDVIGNIKASGTLTALGGNSTNWNSAFAHISVKTNPHEVTKAQVGLGNVTNESKATMFTNPTFTGTTIADSFEANSLNIEGTSTFYDLVTMVDSLRVFGTTKTTILELNTNWKFVKVGNNIELQFDGVTKQIMTDNGDIIATAGVTAYQ